MTNLEITIKYLWTRFDSAAASAASDTLTPYKIRRERIIYENKPLTASAAKGIKVGQAVSVRLTPVGNPLLPLYFAPANSKWAKIPERVWDTLRQKKSLASTTIGELFEELHAFDKAKYPSEWYALGASDKSISRVVIINRIKRVFDYWENTEYHLECTQSATFLPTNFNQNAGNPDPRQLKCEYEGKRLVYAIEAGADENKNSASGAPTISGKLQHLRSKHPNTLKGYTDELQAEIANLNQLLANASTQIRLRTEWANELNKIIQLCKLCNPTLNGENTVLGKATRAAAIVSRDLTSKPLYYFKPADVPVGLPGDSVRELARSISIKSTGVVKIDVSEEVAERKVLIYELLTLDTGLRDAIYDFTVDTIRNSAHSAAAHIVDKFIVVVCGALELLSELIQNSTCAVLLNEALTNVPGPATYISHVPGVKKCNNALEQSLQMIYAILLPIRVDGAKSDAEFQGLYNVPYKSNPGPPVEMLSLFITQAAAAMSLSEAAEQAHRGSDAGFQRIRDSIRAALTTHLPSTMHDQIRLAFGENDEKLALSALSTIEGLIGDGTPVQKRLATLLNIIGFAFASKDIAAGKTPVDIATGIKMAGDVAGYIEIFEGIGKFDRMAKVGMAIGAPIKIVTLFLDFVDSIKEIEIASRKRNNVGAVTGLMKATGSMFAIVLLAPTLACPVLGQVAGALVISAAVVELVNDALRSKTNLLLEALCENVKSSDFYRIVSQDPEFKKLMTKISDLAYAENLPYAPHGPATSAAAKSAGFTDQELVYITGYTPAAGTNAIDGAGGPRQDVPSPYSGGSGGAGGASSY